MNLLYDGRFQIVLSEALFLEYEAVLTRPEQRAIHGFSDDQIEALLVGIARRAERATIYYR